MTQHDDDTEAVTTFAFKGEELKVVKGGFMPPIHNPKAGRLPVRGDVEKVDIVVKKIQEGVSNAHAAIAELIKDEEENVRTTSMERLRKKVRKVLKNTE